MSLPARKSSLTLNEGCRTTPSPCSAARRNNSLLLALSVPAALMTALWPSFVKRHCSPASEGSLNDRQL